MGVSGNPVSPPQRLPVPTTNIKTVQATCEGAQATSTTLGCQIWVLTSTSQSRLLGVGRVSLATCVRAPPAGSGDLYTTSRGTWVKQTAWSFGGAKPKAIAITGGESSKRLSSILSVAVDGALDCCARLVLLRHCIMSGHSVTLPCVAPDADGRVFEIPGIYTGGSGRAAPSITGISGKVKQLAAGETHSLGLTEVHLYWTGVCREWVDFASALSL